VFTNSDESLLLVFVEPPDGPYFILGRFWLTEDISDRFPSSHGGEAPLVAWSPDAKWASATNSGSRQGHDTMITCLP
jgi:hypothetical protein